MTIIKNFYKEILWSDPSDIIQYYQSQRGTGYFFGEDALKNFPVENKLKALNRGHECVNQGVYIRIHESLVTIFSASNYCGIAGNQAGIMYIKSRGKYEIQRFMPLKYLKRSKTIFYSFPVDKIIIVKEESFREAANAPEHIRFRIPILPRRK